MLQTSYSRSRGLLRLLQRLISRRISKSLIPYKAEFLLTERCDSRCRTCGIWRRPDVPAEELSTEQIIRTAASISDQLLWLGLSGGEPTLRSDFADIACGIAESCPDLVMLNFGTNGLDPQRVTQAAKSIVHLDIPYIVCAVSIDGVGELHDGIRGLPGAFDRMVDTAHALAELESAHPNFTLSFQCTVSPLNSERIAEIPAFLHQHFPGRSLIATLACASHSVGSGADPGAMAGAAEKKALRSLMQASEIRGIFDLLPQAYLGLAEAYLEDGKSAISCMGGRDMVMIDQKGEVRPCDFLESPSLGLKHYDFDLKQLLEDDATQVEFNNLQACRRCFSPCWAFPSMMHAPLMSLRGLIHSIYGR